MNKLSKSISFRLAISGILVVLIIGLLMSSFQLVTAYKQQMSESKAALERIMIVAAPLATRSVLTKDKELAQQVVQGILNYPYVLSVEIKGSKGVKYGVDFRPRSPSVSRDLTRLLTNDLWNRTASLSIPNRTSGVLIVRVDVDKALEPFYQKNLSILLMSFFWSSIAVLVLYVVYYFLLVRPISNIAHQICSMDVKKPSTFRIKPQKDHEADEIGLIIQEANFLFSCMRSTINEKHGDLEQVQVQMNHLIYNDPLTNLPNRNYLIERLEEELEKAARQGYYGALLFIDLDQFKSINSLGRLVGDGLLRCIATRIKSTIRDDDLVVRLGADEFVVVLPFLDCSLSKAFAMAEEISKSLRGNISKIYNHDELELRVTCSMGLVVFPEKGAGVHEFLQYGNTAMHQVKESGRDGIRFFNHDISNKLRNTLLMEGNLSKAIQEGQFELYFQPRVDIKTQEVVGAEALLRWNHPERGFMLPDAFLPVLESSELIIDAGLWVIDQACQNLRGWMEQGLWKPNMTLGVNISPRQFKSTRFISEVVKAAEKSQIPLSCLEMEITESVAIDNFDETVSIITQLNAKGVRFALDDFGTGHSSISYLKQLPISVLKIDQSFVKDIQQDRSDRILVSTITAMGNLLGLDVVVEGVETQQQLSILKRLGCGFYQGYLASQPLEKDAFAKSLKDERLLEASIE